MDQQLLTVLVVDDELPLRDELRLYDWAAFGAELIGEAEDGEDALRFCRSFAPDIVITDITMPVMDGLALFRTLREELPQTQVILLTCHSEFTYVREALRHGAIDYLVKVSMSESDLERALNRAKEAIQREKSAETVRRESVRWDISKRLFEWVRRLEDAEDGASRPGSGGRSGIHGALKGAGPTTPTDAAPALPADAASPTAPCSPAAPALPAAAVPDTAPDVVSPPAALPPALPGSPAGAPRAPAAAPFAAPGSPSGAAPALPASAAPAAPEPASRLLADIGVMSRLEPPLWFGVLHVESGRAAALFIRREVEQTLSRWEHPRMPYCWLPLQDSQYLLLFRAEAAGARPIREQWEALLGRLEGTLSRHDAYLGDSVRLYTVISGLLQGPEQWEERLRAACLDRTAAFYDAEGRVFLGRPPAARPAGPEQLRPMEERLRRLQWNPGELARAIAEELPRWARKQRFEPESLKAFATNWLREWMRENGAAAPPDGLRRLAAARTLDELVALLVHQTAAARRQAHRPRKEVTDAQAFVEAHLDQSLTLAVAADRVGLSPSYFSRLFREETGGSFNDYLTRMRMERAIHLLQTTTLRVYEIAYAVGIPSYRYFSALFREWTGMAPTEFKRG